MCDLIKTFFSFAKKMGLSHLLQMFSKKKTMRNIIIFLQNKQINLIPLMRF